MSQESALLTAPTQMTDAEFKQFARMITGELGIKMNDSKSQMLQSRLLRRVRSLGLSGFEAYRQYLFEGADREAERTHFIDAVTTNKTDFFREPRHFNYLTEKALPLLTDGKRFSAREPFRLWCAGCSTGEEAYSLSMVLSEYAEASRTRSVDFQFSLLATDVSTHVLSVAREGIYPWDRIEPIAEPLRKKYLRRHRDPARKTVRIAPALREKISFHSLNFMRDEYNIGARFDAVFFRNVLIYFDRATQERVLNKILACTEPNAFLFVGHSESLSGLKLPVEQVGPAIFRRRN